LHIDNDAFARIFSGIASISPATCLIRVIAPDTGIESGGAMGDVPAPQTPAPDCRIHAPRLK
jgi:hypothetical protein